MTSTAEKSTIKAKLLISLTQEIEVSKDVLSVAISSYLSSYILKNFAEVESLCVSYFSSLLDDGNNNVFDPANVCESLSVNNAISTLIHSEKITETLQIEVEVAITISHNNAKATKQLVEIFLVQEIEKFSQRRSLPFGIEMRCFDCPRIHTYRYKFFISTDTEEIHEAYENEISTYLENIFWNSTSGAFPDSTGSAMDTVILMDTTNKEKINHGEEGNESCKAEIIVDTLIFAKSVSLADQIVFKKDLLHSLRSHNIEHKLKARLNAISSHDICSINVYASQGKHNVNSNPTNMLPIEPRAKPTLSNEGIRVDYVNFNVSFWTKILIVLPFGLACFFAIIFVFLYRRKVKKRLHQVSPIKVEI